MVGEPRTQKIYNKSYKSLVDIVNNFSYVILDKSTLQGSDKFKLKRDLSKKQIG